jgi:hypothetical protein
MKKDKEEKKEVEQKKTTKSKAVKGLRKPPKAQKGT